MKTEASTTKPNFFIVGKPKSGTTALNAMLNQHPDIYMSPVKEPHHFHRDKIEICLRRNMGYKGLPYKDRESCLELFRGARSERIVGEASTGYLYSREAAGAVREFNPDAKIVMIFREPVDFLQAWHSQLVRSANEIEADFGRALRLEDARKRGENIPATADYPDHLFYMDQAKYAEQAERFLRYIPRYWSSSGSTPASSRRS